MDRHDRSDLFSEIEYVSIVLGFLKRAKPFVAFLLESNPFQ
jgi:hypothetical protein